MARELKNSADIIFMPYNYLLDSKVGLFFVSNNMKIVKMLKLNYSATVDEQ